MQAFGMRRTQSLWGVSEYQERSRSTPDPNHWDRKSVLQLVQQYVPQSKTNKQTNNFFSASLPFRNNIFAFMNLKPLKFQLSRDSFEASENFLYFSCK